MSNLIGKLIRWLGYISEIGGLILAWDFRKMHLGGSLPLQAKMPQGSGQCVHSSTRIVPPNKIQLHIGLPPYCSPNLPKRMSAIIAKDMRAEELNHRLAEDLGVNKNRWKLIVVSDEKRPYILDKNENLIEFQSNAKKRLYFYPEIRVR